MVSRKHTFVDEHLAGWTIMVGTCPIAELTHDGIDYPCNIFRVTKLVDIDISDVLFSASRPPDQRVRFVNRQFDVIAADDEFNLGPYGYDVSGEIIVVALRDYRVQQKLSIWRQMKGICQRILGI